MADEDPDFALAFALTTGAGLSTALGAALVFAPSFYTSPVLAICLAFASGVMLYVSFIEIFVKGYDEFVLHFDEINNVNRTNILVDDYTAPPDAYLATTFMFFAGIALTWLLDIVIHILYKRGGREDSSAPGGPHAPGHPMGSKIFEHQQSLASLGAAQGGAGGASAGDKAVEMTAAEVEEGSAGSGDAADSIENAATTGVAPPEGSAPSLAEPAGVSVLIAKGVVEAVALADEETRSRASTPRGRTASLMSEADAAVIDTAPVGELEATEEGGASEASEESVSRFMGVKTELLKMALITGTAVSLHNFPEGLVSSPPSPLPLRVALTRTETGQATFVAAAYSPLVGAPIAVAIAVHNIPEGICVAVPIYFATGSKWKGFMWGTLSGVAEPIAGAVGWLILGSGGTDLGSLTYASLFGLVSGMMTAISVRELLPTARQYDPDDKYVTNSAFAGMAVMAASLVLFAYYA